MRVSRSLAQSKMPWQLKYVGALEVNSNNHHFKLDHRPVHQFLIRLGTNRV